jgi:hypothetical protein
MVFNCYSVEFVATQSKMVVFNCHSVKSIATQSESLLPSQIFIGTLSNSSFSISTWSSSLLPIAIRLGLSFSITFQSKIVAFRHYSVKNDAFQLVLSQVRHFPMISSNTSKIVFDILKHSL